LASSLGKDIVLVKKRWQGNIAVELLNRTAMLKLIRTFWYSDEEREEGDEYCGACMETPCECSDPEQTSTTYG